jgi:TonB family protein
VPPSGESVPKYRLGEDFSVGYWSYRVNGRRWRTVLGTDLGAETPDASFLVLDISARNDDKTPSTLPPFKLVDREGREYESSSKGEFMQGAFSLLKSLNPTVSSRGLIVFDVPPGDYVLKASGGFESGKYALVALETVRIDKESTKPDSDVPVQGQSQPSPTAETTPPRALFTPDPEYSDEARKAHLEGVVKFRLAVGTDGLVHDVEPLNHLGLGLDEQALATLSKWRFKPAMREGKPVPKAVTVEFSFKVDQ